MGKDKLFSNLDESYQDFMKFYDESKVFITRKEMVTIQIKKNIDYAICNFFIPKLKTNSLSID
jgi:hypothetical protein